MRKQFIRFTLGALWLVAAFAAFESCKKSDDSSTVTPSSASVSALTCSSTTFSASAVSGTAYTGTATVPYTGGNGVTYSAGSGISSSGVTGLTATLQAGTLASGAGNLTYAITGTPASSGTASFSLSFGGQTCSLALTVSAASSTTTTTTNSSTVTSALSSTANGITTTVAQIVTLTEAFKSTLSSTQLAATQLTFTKANAQKWSNLPAGLSARYGINLGALNSTQLEAFRKLMVGLLALGVTNEGFDEMLGGMVADDYLNTAGGGSDYGAANFYVSILGTPSTSGLWEILFTGHHYTQPFVFNAGAFTGVTPAFRGVEPIAAVTGGSRTYQPVEQERAAIAAALAGLSSTELATAKQSATYSDLVVGPGQDGNFPTTKLGVQVGTLSSDKQTLVLNIIKLYVNDLDATTAASILATYTSGLSSTYIAYSGTTTMSTQNDYFRIDGPRVWIEYSAQGGIVIKNTPHPHVIWRDRSSDYGGN